MEITDIIPTRSFNTGTVKGARVLENSIRKLGYCKSIVVDRNNKVLIGNKVLNEAVKAGAKVRVIETQGDELVVVKRKDIDYDTRKAKDIMLVDNLTTELNLVYDTDYIIDTMNKVWGFDPRNWEGHSCLVQELSVEDCIKEGLAAVDRKETNKEEKNKEENSRTSQLFLFD